jgi:phosphate-selective porin OprO/OprP
LKFSKLVLAAAAALGASTSSLVFAIDLYVDTKTKHIFAEPGPDRQPLGTYERVQGTPSNNATPAPEAERIGQSLPGDRNARIKEKAERAQLVGKVESLEERFKESEKQLKLDKNGLQFETADKNFKFKIGGRIHTDYTHSSNDHFFRGGVPVQANDGAELRRGDWSLQALSLKIGISRARSTSLITKSASRTCLSHIEGWISQRSTSAIRNRLSAASYRKAPTISCLWKDR